MIWGYLLGFALGAGPLAAAEPSGFQRLDSEHFIVYSEAFYPPEGLLNELEGLHAKVALDLVLFSPWTAARVDLARRRIYAFQSPELRRILAHELGHLFFDDFFLAASSGPALAGHPPRWLTEGVAVNMEWDYGLDQERPFNPVQAAKRMRPLPEALRRAYGPGFADLAELERRWREDLKGG